MSRNTLLSSLTLFCTACHAGSARVATTPTPARTAAECASVVAPERGDSAYRRLVPPMVVVPQSPGFSMDFPEYTTSLAVRVDRAGQIDSVVVLSSRGGVGEMLGRRLLGGRAKAARYQGCAVTAWAVVGA